MRSGTWNCTTSLYELRNTWAADLGGPIVSTTVMSRASPDGSCEDEEGTEALFSSRYEDKKDGDDDDEIPTKEQYVEVWLRPGLPPQFLWPHVGGPLGGADTELAITIRRKSCN